MEKPETKTLIHDLTEGSVLKTQLVFAFPLMCSNLLQTLYYMVDMVVIGQFVGKEGLSAVSISSDVLHLLTFLVIGLSSAGQVLLAQAVGEKNPKRISDTIGTLFTVTMGSGIGVGFLFLFLLENILGFMNTPEEVFASAKGYCLTCIGGLLFIYGYNMVSAVLRGLGDSRRPFLFVAIATVTNLILDLVFIPGMGLGVFGAALATVIGQAVSFFMALVYLYRHKAALGFSFHREDFRVNRQVLGRLLRLGIPMCLQSAAISLSMIVVNSYINAYGTTASAVTGIGNKLSSVTSIVTLALSTAGSTMIGQCIGGRKYERVTKVILVNLVISGLFAGILSLITLVFPEALFGLFNREEQVLEMAMTYVPVAVLMYGGYAMRSPSFALINGSGNGKLNLAVALLDGVVCRIGLTILMGSYLGMGIRGFWLGSALAGYVPGLIGSVYFFSKKWKEENNQ